jgi:alanine dehydrogenase
MAETDPTVLTDSEFDALVPMEVAVARMEEAFREHAAGTLRSPPRFGLDVEEGSLVFTAGAAEALGAMGFRVYQTVAEGDQLVASFDTETGTLEGVVIGTRLGAVRTGAIGGVAVDHLAREDAVVLGVLGSGKQARTQVEAVTSVRAFEEARVFSPTRENREAFAREASREMEVEAVASAETAVRGADVLIVATTSTEPVFDPEWLAPGAHVTTLGPKFEGASEIDPSLPARCDSIVTDSLAQVDGYDRPYVVSGDERDRTVELSAIVAGEREGRSDPDDRTLFCSVGLAGTEVVLARAAFEAATNG